MQDQEAINGRLDARVVVDTASMDWTPSPSRQVLRKRVHRVGPPESGQVTSVVRYEPGSAFPAHEHPEGEEILVLDGVFSDEHGDWPAGTYLLNPEGFRHAPFSRPGCTLLVKLRQYPGSERRHVALETDTLDWQPSSADGVAIKPLYAQTGFSDVMRLERWTAGASRKLQCPGGVELFVLDGALESVDGRFTAGTWLRLPPGREENLRSSGGATLYMKEGRLRLPALYLRP